MELKLLLGKIYSQWKGHDSQALAAYEAIIRDDPDDFRSAWGLCSLCEHLRGSSGRTCGHHASGLLFVTRLLKTHARTYKCAVLSHSVLHGR